MISASCIEITLLPRSPLRSVLYVVTAGACGAGVGVISMFGVAVSCSAGVFVAPKTMKLFSCCGCWVACGTGVFTTVGAPAPNMDRTIITIISTRIRIRPIAIIIGVLSCARLPCLLPFV